jgi:hypothetical protein
MRATADRLEKSKTPNEIILSSGATYTIGVKNRVTTIGVDNAPGGCFSFNSQTIKQNDDQDTEEFDDEKYYTQGENGPCGITTLVNMDIDIFGVNLGKEMIECAEKKKIPWKTGVNAVQLKELFFCKLSLLAKLDNKASFTTNNFPYRENPAFNSSSDEKSPCKDISNVLKNGGGVLIKVFKIKGGVNGHYTQVHKIDCARGTMTLNDPYGVIVKISFDEDGKITSVLPEEMGELKGANIISYTTENKK